MLKSNGFILPSFQYLGLLITLAGLFVTGGSARGDVQSLIILYPAMIICCGLALLTLARERHRSKSGLLFAACAVFFLVALYLFPFLGHLEVASGGRTDLGDIQNLTDVTGTPQILAVAPFASRQSFFFLFAPLAVMLFSLQLDRDELRRTLPFIILLGAISGILGVLQLAGSAGGKLYFYDITNNGSAVGLFANRNHAAVFLACLFPMLAIFVAKSQATRRKNSKSVHFIAIALATLLVPLILVTGSRAGLITGIIGLVGGIVLYLSHAPSDEALKARTSLALASAVAVLFCLVFVTVYLARAEAVDRIFVGEGTTNSRADFWSSSLALFWHYFPTGFGAGAFVSAFQMNEPASLLDSLYLNRLHNDWFETVLAFGLLGILLLSCATAYFIRRFVALWFQMDGRRTTVALGRMASVIIIILGVASMTDYPLRTPAIMGFFALVLVWFSEAR